MPKCYNYYVVCTCTGDHQRLLANVTYIVYFLIVFQSKEYIDTLQMNGSVDTCAFTRDGTRLLSAGGDGEVYVWDMSTRQCVHR